MPKSVWVMFWIGRRQDKLMVNELRSEDSWAFHADTPTMFQEFVEQFRPRLTSLDAKFVRLAPSHYAAWPC